MAILRRVPGSAMLLAGQWRVGVGRTGDGTAALGQQNLRLEANSNLGLDETRPLSTQLGAIQLNSMNKNKSG